MRGQDVVTLLTVPLLAKMVTLGLALLAMNLVFNNNPNAGEMALWVAIAGVAAAALTGVLRAMQAPSKPWIRLRLWPDEVTDALH